MATASTRPKRAAVNNSLIEPDSDYDDFKSNKSNKSSNTKKKTLKTSEKIDFKSFDDDDDDDDDDDKIVKAPAKKKRKLSSSTTKKPTTKKIKKEENGTAKGDKQKKAAIKKITKNSKTPAAKKKTVKQEKKDEKIKSIVKNEETEDAVKAAKEEEDFEKAEEYKWWEQQNEDDTIKWQTLVHNGVIFPPEYEPLPSHIKLYYDKKPVTLPPQAEEVAGFFAALIESEHAKNPVFQKNFFADFKQVLKESGGVVDPPKFNIKDFSKCDFTKIFEYFELKKQEKKQLTKAEKKQIKLEKEKLEEPYKFCYLDGRKEQVGNFRIEPPSLFRGRGAHPKTGKLKRRVYPEEVVLNLGADAPVPEPPAGHHWGEVKHDNTVQWLAMWRENISNSFKYVRFAANSSLKGMSDFKKFEKARELKDHIEVIRKDYEKNLYSKVTFERQIAVATYLIDIFALRAGGEKSEDEADTVGCCSLRYEHVTLKPPQTVIFDFLGKDSIRFHQEVEVDKQVFKSLAIFKKHPKKPGDQLFDRLDPSILNKHLQNYMPGLTAKVFRTYNASKTMQDQLDLIPNTGTVAEKILKYNAANRTVAILCNHQRTVGKNHEQSVLRATEKIEEWEWSKIRLKRAILQLDPEQAKVKGQVRYFSEIKKLTKTKEKKIHKRVLLKEKEKLEKKFQRENEKLKENKEPVLKASVLKEWLAKIDDLEKQYEQELENDGKWDEELLKKQTVTKLKAQVEKLEARIRTNTIQLKDKEDNSQVALGTSKINYIDPRLSVVFCKKYNVPLEKVFTKTLRDKFKWAIESVDSDWRF